MKDPFEIYSNLQDSNKPRPLDFEETAADSASFIEGIHDRERQAPNIKPLKALLVVIFSLFVLRIFYLQIVQGKNFRALSENNRIRKQILLAPRGLIEDRNGQILTQNTASFHLIAIPFDLPKEGLDTELNRLANVLGLDVAAMHEKLANLNPKSLEPIVLKQDLSAAQSILFETKASEFVGFSVSKVPVRQYLQPLVFFHVLGYTGLLDAAELQAQSASSKNYNSVDYIGKAGIESTYEQYLHGTNGQDLVEVDATSKLVNVLGETEPEAGSTLILNIDKGLQEKLYEGFTANGKSAKGAAIAINPKNGQVLALLSLPGFDNNLFAHGISDQDYSNLLANKLVPLFNRAISGMYPPGSTVKPMVAAAALEEKVVDENTVIVDRGLLVIPNQFDPTIAYNFYGWKRTGLGAMNIRSAIAQSSDIYFYTVSGGHPSSPVRGLGAEKLADYYRKFNLGQLTGIDLNGEKPGLVADPEWKANYYKTDPILSKWYLGDTYHIGIGQGDILATPLQVAEWTAIIANNGVGYKPQVVSKIIDNTGKIILEQKPEILVNRFLSEQNLKIVQEGMRLTVTAGSGRQLNTLPITAAGKTGTSQFDGSDPNRTHAWFTAYAPFEDPQIVITVLVEAGGEGHAAAVPIVKEALKWWAENRYNK